MLWQCLLRDNSQQNTTNLCRFSSKTHIEVAQTFNVSRIERNAEQTNSLVYKHTNTSTNQLINLQAHQLVSSQTHQLTSPPTRQLTNLSTHKFINLQAHQLTSPSTHQLKELILLLLFYNTVLIFIPF